jgi:chromosome segregation ATPase
MTASMTREQAAAAVKAAVAERDTIQANLLDLDGSFGKRMLAGARLVGETQQRWAATEAQLAALWETFTAYSAVVDRAAELTAKLGRSPGSKIDEVGALLTGPSVRLARTAPLGQRQLTSGAGTDLTLRAAVVEMQRGYTDASALCATAETIWTQIADGLQQASSSLEEAKRLSAGLTDDALASALTTAEASLGQLRDTLNTNPLALWRHGHGDTAGLDRLREQTAAAVARAGELARLRDGAGRRIAALTAAISAAGAARQDAAAAQDAASARIAGAADQQLPDPDRLSDALATLTDLQRAGRWTRLAAELDSLEKETAAATQRCRDAERAAAALLGRRDELRGLLDAYKAKAAALGAAENSELEAAYGKARDALWTAPCDLVGAAAAVTGYQQAVLALSARGRRS